MGINNELYHYGVGHLDGGHSGRYPWGSGDRPNQREVKHIKRAGGLFNRKPDDGSILSGKASDFSLYPKIKKSETTMQRLKAVNPHGYGKPTDRPTHMNCGNCVLANEARLKGIDAAANGNAKGLTIKELKSAINLKRGSEKKLDIKVDPMENDSLAAFIYSFYGATLADENETKLMQRGQAVEKEFQRNIAKEFPDNSRGCLFIPGVLGSHFVSWNKDSSGNVSFENPQDVNVNLTRMWFSQYKDYGDVPAAKATAIRLDDVEFNNEITKLISPSGDLVKNNIKHTKKSTY